MMIPINLIDFSLQVRPLDEETVRDYADALRKQEEQEVELPPVTVALDTATNTRYLVDGFHRLEAHKRIGKQAIIATVIEMSKQDALWYALGANRINGRRLTNEDKRSAIKIAMEEFPNASSRTIADHIGCSHQMVCNHRKSSCQPLTPAPVPSSDTGSESDDAKLQPTIDTPEQNIERVTGRDDKSYPKTKPKPQNQLEQVVATDSSEVGATELDTTCSWQVPDTTFPPEQNDKVQGSFTDNPCKQKIKQILDEMDTIPVLLNELSASIADEPQSDLTKFREMVFERCKTVITKIRLRLYIKTKGVTASGYEVGKRFVVLQGSQASMGEIPQNYEKAKLEQPKLLLNGILQEENGVYVFTQDYEFDSPTLAASIILAEWKNGLEEWKDEDGRTLKALRK